MAKRRELLEGTDSATEEAIRLTTRPRYVGRCISAPATKSGNFAFDARKMWEWFHCLTGGYRARAPGESIYAISYLRPYFGQSCVAK